VHRDLLLGTFSLDRLDRGDWLMGFIGLYGFLNLLAIFVGPLNRVVPLPRGAHDMLGKRALILARVFAAVVCLGPAAAYFLVWRVASPW
jgi:hypothetical protein